MYQGKSTNTLALLIAVLKSEGLVRNLEGKIRGYEILHSKSFIDEMNALMATDIDLKATNIPANYKTSVAFNKPGKSITKIATTIKAKKSPLPIETPIAIPESSIAN